MTARILLIDDDARLTTMLGDYLFANGYDVDSADSLAAGRARLNGGALPDAVVLDLMLPDGDGLDFCRELRAQARTRGLPPEEVIEKIMLEPAAIKRLIEPGEVADFVAYLCSPAGGVFTGAALTMDLGWTAR